MVTKLRLATFLSLVSLFLACALVPVPARADNPRYASLVIDADSGVVLHQENAGKQRYPASLTKMMTLYLAFQALERGKLRMDQKIRVSSRASGQPPSKLGLRPGNSIMVRDAILAIVIKSANDVSVTLAESVGGSEWQFATMMNRMAKKLGMNNTNFVNASGLYNKRQVTTAYDMARLAVALRRDYPKYYHLFNRSQFYYNGRVYRTHNRVTSSYRGADGLKTGYVNASGYNLVTSARRSGHSIVGVVLGGRTSRRRDNDMVKLLDQAFSKVAKGKVGNEAIYTGTVPLPNLKPGRTIQASTPEPSLKPQSSQEISSEVIKASENFSS